MVDASEYVTMQHQVFMVQLRYKPSRDCCSKTIPFKKSSVNVESSNEGGCACIYVYKSESDI